MSDFEVLYQGRKWDAPLTDEAVEVDLSGETCLLCREQIAVDDDAIATSHMITHLECHLRMALGSVEHLEGRCLCSGDHSVSPDLTSFRDGARASLQWTLEHGRGRFHEEPGRRTAGGAS